MQAGNVAGVPGLSPRDASAALALVTAATEPRLGDRRLLRRQGRLEGGGRAVHYGGTDGLTPLTISPRQRLDDAVRAVSGLPFGGTDCALPMLYARAQELEIDTFVIYTDSRDLVG